MRERVDLKSPVREYRPPGSVRGARGDPCPYLDKSEMLKAEGEGRRAKGGGRRAEDGGLEVAINDFIGFVRRAKTDPTIIKADYVREIQKLVPALQHHETGRNLDQKM